MAGSEKRGGGRKRVGDNGVGDNGIIIVNSWRRENNHQCRAQRARRIARMCARNPATVKRRAFVVAYDVETGEKALGIWVG